MTSLDSAEGSARVPRCGGKAAVLHGADKGIHLCGAIMPVLDENSQMLFRPYGLFFQCRVIKCRSYGALRH